MFDQLHFTVAQYASICDSLPDPTFILTESGCYAAVLGGKDRRYYHDGSMLVGRFLDEVLVPSKAEWFLAQIRRALNSSEMLVVDYELSGADVLGLSSDGPVEPIWFEGRITALPDTYAGEPAVMWVASNITRTKHLQQQLRHLDHNDALTGVRNRRYFMHNLRWAFDNFRQYGRPACMMYLDVDDFKAINEHLGIAAGDQALCDVVAALGRQMGDEDLLCRVGDDEFALLCQGRNLDSIAALAQQLLEVGQQALQSYATPGTRPALSLGIAHIQAADPDMHSVMQRADQALSAAKLQSSQLQGQAALWSER